MSRARDEAGLGRLREYMARRRAERRAAMRQISGHTCSLCPSPVWGFVSRVAGPPREPARRGDRAVLENGPSDMGLTSRAALLYASLAGRLPVCRRHMAAIQTGRLAARRAAEGRGA